MAIARPWLFTQWTQGIDAPDSIYKEAALRLSALVQHYYEFKSALRRFQRYAPYLAANFAFGNSLFNRLRNAPDFETIDSVLQDFFQNDPQRRIQPNLNFLR
jgi:tRNA-dihydrouridine synthase